MNYIAKKSFCSEGGKYYQQGSKISANEYFELGSTERINFKQELNLILVGARGMGRENIASSTEGKKVIVYDAKEKDSSLRGAFL